MNCDLELRSDTFSTPCSGMRKAIAEAMVGDDVFGEDPTINSLEERVAGLLGKDAGLFVPSGTMGNGLAIRTLASPGERILCGTNSHLYNFEGDQFALNCGLQMHRMDETANGMIPFESIQHSLDVQENIHRAPVTVLALENTHNLLGGRILPGEKVVEACAFAHSRGVKTYLDGARLWHAHAATGIALSKLAEPFDMVSVCFSKALGAPVGSMVLGPGDLVEKARWFRKRMGGGMRQAGILGGACHYALDNNLPRLQVTCGYARKLAKAFKSTGSFEVDINAIDTNIVFLRTEPGKAADLVFDLMTMGISVLALDASSVRFVTHLSLDPQCVDEAVNRIAKEF
ncbi:MAG: low specificity L-threonine aldolase [Candidatus Sabulitectum sp.]|nr:low specificity L-threonine aldolase [Candidatus Sabulitectum sp.]